MPLSICAPVSANWPEYWLLPPIFTVSCALARTHARAASLIAAKKHMLLFILSSPAGVRNCRPILVQVGCERNACLWRELPHSGDGLWPLGLLNGPSGRG